MTVLKNTNIYDFEFLEDTNFVRNGVLKNLDGRKRTVSARFYVIACGGLENPQVLLNIDRLSGGVLTGKTKAIGKYYMDHAGLMGRSTPFKCIRPDLADWRHFPEYGDNPLKEGDYYFVRPVYHLDPKIAEYRDFPQHGIMIDRFHPGCSYRTEYEFENLMWDLEFENFGKGNVHAKKGPLPPVYLDFAPSPNSTSTVELTGRKNALGHFFGKLNWSLNGDDVLLAIGIAKAFETRMAENGIARIKLSREIEESGLLTEYGTARNDSHHMGATRMSDSPKNGVVDRNCRIHGLENCYIAGASVFPSYDWTGPTFTALAMTFRLSDHLKNRLA